MGHIWIQDAIQFEPESEPVHNEFMFEIML